MRAKDLVDFSPIAGVRYVLPMARRRGHVAGEIGSRRWIGPGWVLFTVRGKHPHATWTQCGT